MVLALATPTTPTTTPTIGSTLAGQTKEQRHKICLITFMALGAGGWTIWQDSEIFGEREERKRESVLVACHLNQEQQQVWKREKKQKISE